VAPEGGARVGVLQEEAVAGVEGPHPRRKGFRGRRRRGVGRRAVAAPAQVEDQGEPAAGGEGRDRVLAVGVVGNEAET
jgi:hypothetical protein